MKAVLAKTPLPHQLQNPDDLERLGPLEPVLLRCLHEDPSQRPSMRTFLAELCAITRPMHTAETDPAAQPQSQHSVPYVDNTVPFASQLGSLSPGGSSASTSNPTRGSSYVTDAPDSSVWSPPVSVTGQLHNDLTHILDSTCDLPTSMGATYPQSAGGNFFEPSSAPQPHSQGSGSIATNSSGRPHSLVGWHLKRARRVTSPLDSLHADSYDSTEVLLPSSGSTAPSPPTSTLGAAQTQRRMPPTTLGAAAAAVPHPRRTAQRTAASYALRPQASSFEEPVRSAEEQRRHEARIKQSALLFMAAAAQRNHPPQAADSTVRSADQHQHQHELKHHATDGSEAAQGAANRQSPDPEQQQQSTNSLPSESSAGAPEFTPFCTLVQTLSPSMGQAQDELREYAQRSSVRRARADCPPMESVAEEEWNRTHTSDSPAPSDLLPHTGRDTVAPGPQRSS